MFTCLLDVDPDFPGMESGPGKAGERRVTAALTAWWQSDSKNMHAFAREWARRNPPEEA
jgi:hypothetical protein